MTPGSGQRIDLRHGFDFGPVERAGQACPMRKQHADTRRIALDHLDWTGYWHGCRLQHPQIPPVRAVRTRRLSRSGRPVTVASL